MQEKPPVQWEIRDLLRRPCTRWEWPRIRHSTRDSHSGDPPWIFTSAEARLGELNLSCQEGQTLQGKSKASQA